MSFLSTNHRQPKPLILVGYVLQLASAGIQGVKTPIPISSYIFEENKLNKLELSLSKFRRSLS
jgi:hypothetical protein